MIFIYFKALTNITGNDGVDGKGGYVFVVADTSEARISDGAYWGNDTFGGFWGGTKFIYGDGENEYFLATSKENNEVTDTFEFK